MQTIFEKIYAGNKSTHTKSESPLTIPEGMY